MRASWLFALGLSLTAALLSGLAPALHASKADVVSALKDDAQAPGSAASAERVRRRAGGVQHPAGGRRGVLGARASTA